MSYDDAKQRLVEDLIVFLTEAEKLGKGDVEVMGEFMAAFQQAAAANGVPAEKVHVG